MNTGDYIRETKVELKHVSWPTRRQSIIYTIVVIAISLITGIYLGIFDKIFTILLQKVLY